MKFPAAVLEAIQTLEQAGHACYAAGGSVRDKLLGKPCSDYDLATSATPDQIEQLFEKTVPTGKKHGTITAFVQGMPLEITTFRKESAYQDHRHPDKVEFVQTIEEDLARRDFTINAMAWNPATGVIDPYGGRKDLLSKTIRCVGNPDTRFQEDALRMVRAHRFAARFRFQIEEQTKEAIGRNSHLISHVAVERLWKEWMEILEKNPRQVKDMLPLFRPWIPELEACAATPQQSPYHYTGVLDHILDSISFLKPFDEMLAFTLLLHDLGKPATHTNKGGRDHFYRHPQAGAAIASRIVEDLKLNSQYKKIIPELVLRHDDIMGCTPASLYKYRVTLGWPDERVQQLFKIQYCDIMAHSQKGRQRLERLNQAKAFYESEKDKRPLSISELDIDGKEIIRYAGLQGKEVGLALQASLERCFYHPEHNTRLDILTFILKNKNRFKKGGAH